MFRLTGKYGETILTRRRWFSSDLEKVEKDWRIWVEHERRGESVIWGSSVLGVINGILYKIGDPCRLVATVEEDGTISKWELRKFDKTKDNN